MAPNFTKRIHSQDVLLGSPAKFSCKVDGEPPPTVTWYICFIYYFAPGTGANDCDEYVCLSVCPIICSLAYLRNHAFVVRVDRGRGTVLFCQHCNTLCTSGFMDDVSFRPTVMGTMARPTQVECKLKVAHWDAERIRQRRVHSN